MLKNGEFKGSGHIPVLFRISELRLTVQIYMNRNCNVFVQTLKNAIVSYVFAYHGG